MKKIILIILGILFSISVLHADNNNNDTCGNAEAIALPYDKPGEIGYIKSGSARDKDDYFTFEIPAWHSVSISTTGAGQNIDAHLYGMCIGQNSSDLLGSDTTSSNNISIVYNNESPSSKKVWLRLGTVDKNIKYILKVNSASLAPQISFQNTAISMQEGDSDYKDMNFTVSLSSTATKTISVDYNTTNITATAPDDYNATNGTLVFNVGDKNKIISVPIKGETAPEEDESFKLTLSNPTNATLNNAKKVAIGTIIDDDRIIIRFSPKVYSASEDLSLPNGASSSLNLYVTLSKASTSDIFINFRTVDGSAKGTSSSGTDFISQDATLLIPAGQTTATIPMYIIHDYPIELDEQFGVELYLSATSSPVVLDPYSKTATVTITEQTTAPLCYEDNFNQSLEIGTDASSKGKWRSLYSKGGYAPATKGGRLRMTEGRTGLATAVTRDYEFPSAENLIIVEFDHFAYGGCFQQSGITAANVNNGYVDGADGIVAVLFDSEVGASPRVGAWGGSMGYANMFHNNVATPGFEGGWLGLGLDEYGNYAMASEGKTGGTAGLTKNSVTIRGDHQSVYKYLKGTSTLNPPIAPVVQQTLTPVVAPGHRYKMTIDARDPSKLPIKLERKLKGTAIYETLIDKFDARNVGQSATPAYVRFALTSGTGGGCNAHEIEDLEVRGNCNQYDPSPKGNFRVTEYTSNSTAWSVKWLDNKLKTQVAPLENKRYCVLAGDRNNDSASPITSPILVDVNLSVMKPDNSFETTRVVSDLNITTASTNACFDVGIPKATKKAYFIVTPKNAPDSVEAYSDSFAIRPHEFIVNIDGESNLLKLIAAKPYVLKTIATSKNGSLVSPPVPLVGYNGILGSSTGNTYVRLTSQPNISTCPNNDVLTESMIFSDGSSFIDPFKYPDVMRVKIEVYDQNWTAVDQSNGDCTLNSDSITTYPVGCAIKGEKIVHFNPHRFLIEGNFTNFNKDHNYTYISNDLNMSSSLDMKIKALSFDGNITKSYNKLCYAQNTNYTLFYSMPTPTPLGSITHIKAHETNTSKDIVSTLGNSMVLNGVSKDIFETSNSALDFNGTAKLQFKVNFDRNITKVVNPFRLTFNKVDVNDTNDVSGSTGPFDQNATFYYGRVYSTDYRGTSPIDSVIRYEVYCDGCNKTDFKITGTQSPTSVRWYQNPLHGNTADGNVTSFVPNNSVTNVASPTVSTIANGFDTTHRISRLPANVPYVDKIKMTPSSWLLYNQFNSAATTNDFNVEFTSSGGWAGQGDTGKTIKANPAQNTDRKMNW